MLHKHSSASSVTADKPRGIADTGRHPLPINTVIEDFEYQREGSGTQSGEEEDGADDLEYPGGMAESLVRPFSCPSLQ